MKVRKHDYNDMLRFNPEILEFHFSDSDLSLELEGNFSNNLMIHCYEYFNRKLLDIVSLEETNQIHSQERSIELVQKAIDKTKELGKQFRGTPSLILHPGGYSLFELSKSDIDKMKNNITKAVEQLDLKGVNLLLENMPPYAWFFGGRWFSNCFLSSSEILDYCQQTGLKVCYDLCHSYLYCNKEGISITNELKLIKNLTQHFHLSDGKDVDGEGLQFGEGDLPFNEIIPILNEEVEKSFAIEVWKGHEQKGKGFEEFLDKIKIAGLIVN